METKDRSVNWSNLFVGHLKIRSIFLYMGYHLTPVFLDRVITSGPKQNFLAKMFNPALLYSDKQQVMAPGIPGGC